jgi:hypothetical protein
MAGTGRWSSPCGLAMARRKRPGHGAVRVGVDQPAFKGEQGGGEGVPLRSKAAGHGMGNGMATVRQQRHRPGGAVGAARPVRARCVALGEWGREAVQRSGEGVHGACEPADRSRPQRAVRQRTGSLRGARVVTLCTSARALAPEHRPNST